MTHELLCQAGPDTGKRFPLSRAETVIGRDPGCDLMLNDEFVSRRHVKLLAENGGHTLVNLSAVGTLLNDKPTDRATLAVGDVFQLGPTSKLRYQKAEPNKPVASAITPVMGSAKPATPAKTAAVVPAVRSAVVAATGQVPPSVTAAPVTATAPAVSTPVVTPPAVTTTAVAVVAPTATEPAAEIAPTEGGPPTPTSSGRSRLIIGASAYAVLLVGLFLFLSGLKRSGDIEPPPTLSDAQILEHLKKGEVPLPTTKDEITSYRNRAMSLYRTNTRRLEDLYRIYELLRGVQQLSTLSGEEDRAMNDAMEQLRDRLYVQYQRAYISDRANQTERALRQYQELRSMIPNHRLEIYKIAVERERLLSSKR